VCLGGRGDSLRKSQEESKAVSIKSYFTILYGIGILGVRFLNLIAIIVITSLILSEMRSLLF